jgi:hypothetical protein
MRDIKLYNVIFPLWFIIFIPPYIFIPLLGNLMIDGLVIYLTLRASKSILTKGQLGKIVLYAWSFGFFADLLGAGLLFLFSMYLQIDSYRIWTDPLTVFFYLFSVGVTGLIIFGFNNWLLKKNNISDQVSRRVGLAMGIITAPWLFLVPAVLFYG